MAAFPLVVAKPFGKLADGTGITLYTLTNSEGAKATIMTYGGIVTSLHMPDREGCMGDVVLGFDDLAPYINGDGTPYFGAIIGRYCNRIASGKFSINERVYQLATNDCSHHLHGGRYGFDKKVWQAHPFTSDSAACLELSLLSPDGDQGFPGNLRVSAIYRLTNANALEIEFSATTDKTTPVSLTQHSYFNLSGDATIARHRLKINANYYTPVDKELLPTGEIAPVAGTPLDFRSPVAIGERLDAANQQLKWAGGYDHNFVLDKLAPAELVLAARVDEQRSGRVLEVFTEEPGLQFYSGNFLDSSLVSRGKAFGRHSGFCLEPQHFPDSPNQVAFPSTLLQPGQTYRTRSSFVFSVQNAH